LVKLDSQDGQVNSRYGAVSAVAFKTVFARISMIL